MVSNPGDEAEGFGLDEWPREPLYQMNAYDVREPETSFETWAPLDQWADFSLFEPVLSAENNYNIMMTETFPFENYPSSLTNSMSTCSSPTSTDFHSTSPVIKADPDFALSAMSFDPIPTYTQPPSSTSPSSSPSPLPPPRSQKPRSKPARKPPAAASKPKAPQSPSAIERRRQQNRASQMAFRERTKKLVDDLRRELAASEAERKRLEGVVLGLIGGEV
ncbi:hypothetical protein BJ875DRAFT_439547 [Amylocarpus encephaloides]|uniref:BZIP domain-containing protein n=1 Tax=Amylocarpus encephaloides TaxID=45428 RepID=A0A9P8C715_9HELO|nr:hypothetical protein BJ875DRAFT_439547 [Amylocarpus encephaloides]